MSIPVDPPSPTPESGAVRVQQTVDAQGVLCPVPIIRLARAATALPPGTVLELLTDDPAAAHDVPAWCRLRGHELLGTTALGTTALGASGLAASSARGAAGEGSSGAAPAGQGTSGERQDPAAARQPGASLTGGLEPHAPNPAPGQVLRHLIRLAGPVSSAAVPS